VVNLKTAKALGLTVPGGPKKLRIRRPAGIQALLLRSD